MRAGDVMTPDPDIGGTWMTVADFIDRIALASAQAGFPVVAPGGSLAGATGVSRLARVPPASRASTTLGQILTPVPPRPMIRPPRSPATLQWPTTWPPSSSATAGSPASSPSPRLRQIIGREALRAQPAR
jgi:hypothetical protein